MIMPSEDVPITSVIRAEEAMKDFPSMHSKLKPVVENGLNRLAIRQVLCMYAELSGARNPRLRSTFDGNIEVNP